MKAIILILLATTVAWADPNKVCVTIVAEDQDRVTEAFGSILGLNRPATLEEIESATAQWLGQSTHDFERRRAQTSFTPPPFSEASGKMNPPPPAPTPSPAYTPKPAPTQKAKK